MSRRRRHGIRPGHPITTAWLAALSLYAAGACQTMTDSDSNEDLPDFTLSVNPSSRTTARSGSTQFNVDIAYVNGFESTNVSFSTSDPPAGITATFDPNPLPHQGRSVLTLTADGATPGVYTISVRALAEGLTRSQDITLEITDNPDFSVSISPATQNVAAGGSAGYQVTVTALNGFADPVTLAVSGVPAGASGSFSTNPVVPTATTTLTVATSQTTAAASYDLAITATAGSLERSLEARLEVTPPGAAWMIGSVGNTSAANNCVRVGPARNDGVVRVYVGTVTTGRIFEFTRSGSTWQSLDIGGSPSGEEIHNMGIGPGRNDGVIRIYAASVDGEVYELSYGQSGWTQTTVGTPVGAATHAAVGDGRGDGINRVYATRGASVLEYTWTGSEWSALEVGQVASGSTAHGIVIGDGRGDGSPHLYVAATTRGVYEASFAGGSWSLAAIGGNLGDTRNVNVGPGRDDGVRRVYAARAAGVMTELTWTGSDWTQSDVNASIGAVLVHAYVVAGRNDGVMRVYSSGANGNSYEWTWNGSAWTQYTLGGGADYMYGFHYGTARNDGVTYLYGASFNSQVYEYGWQ